MLAYEEVTAWTENHDLILNRVGIANQILGCRFDHSPDNPLVVEQRRGGYVCKVGSAYFHGWKLYDASSSAEALKAIDSFKQGLWLLNRTGRLSYT